MDKFLLLFCLLSTGCSLITPTGYDGPATENFNGIVFSNLEPLQERGFVWPVIKWRLTSKREVWPDWVTSEAGATPPAKVGRWKVRYTVINHATVLIQTDELNILTDPIWSERCSPFGCIGPKRVREPGLSIEQLPKIDVVLISHNHYDHMDLPTLEKLYQRDHPVILSGLGNAEYLAEQGIDNGVSLNWWEAKKIGDVAFHFVPAQHFSRRGLFDGNKTLWGGFVIQCGYGNIYFAGDTGYGHFFRDIRQRFGAMDLSFIPIGAYEPRWFMKAVHLNPEDAVKAHLDLDSSLSVGIHFGTFQLTDEGLEDPGEDLSVALEKYSLESKQFLVPVFGQGHELRRLDSRPKLKQVPVK